jgi:hypothetical protein
MVAVGVMLLSTLSPMVTSAQGEAEAPAGDQLFSAEGVEASVLARAEIEQLDPDSTLLLELIELVPGTEMPLRETRSPELFFILSGTVVFHDNFGFVSAVEAGTDVSLNADIQYTIANPEREPGRFLRLRLAAAGDAGATPDAAPATGGTITALARVSLQDLPLDRARMYLGRARFGAGADSGDQAHTGPIALFIQSGALDILSPSGLVGTIGAGQAVSLPPATPLRASTGGTEAVAFIAGVSGSDDATFTRIWSAADGTPPDTVLDPGQAWRTQTATLTVDIHQYSQVMGIDLVYTNIGESNIDVTIDPESITMTDDSDREWRFLRTDCPAAQELSPGDEIACSAHFNPPPGTARGPLVLSIGVGAMGDVRDATWRAKIDW